MPLERAINLVRQREAELARVQRIGGMGGLEVDLREGGFRNSRSPEYLAIHGLPPEAANETHEEWVARIHPEDRERVVRHFRDVLASDSRDYEVEYRIIRPSDGETRWIMAKAEIERDAAGRALRLVGAHIDITARRTAEEQRELIARELAHRISNIFAVVNSLITMSARSDPSARDFADALAARIQALHRAHDLVSPRGESKDIGLKALIARLLEPYRLQAGERISVQGDDIAVGKTAATALALIFHELATNAVKYGSLSLPEGQVDLTLESQGARYRILWRESGGPEIPASPQRRGFGSTMVDRAARSQLGAVISHDWNPSGLSVIVDAAAAKLAV